MICGLSGGVDSAVAAALVHKAIGDQLTCVFVDTGLLRAGEADQVEPTFREQFNVDLVHVKAADRFLGALDDVIDPERKRKIIGETFIRVFEEAAADLGDARFLVQGTLYPDIIESGTKDAARIKSHHNVGGLPDDMQFELVEPLRNLFKDEVRAVGEELGLPEEIVWRQPFPGPGLAVRIVGTVTAERVAILQAADAIVTEEIRRAGLYRELWQSFAVLPVVRTVGVMGDERTYAYPIVIRAVTSDDAMTADWARLPYDVLERLSSRIINEVPGVNRVAFDITSKPPGTIEWECNVGPRPARGAQPGAGGGGHPPRRAAAHRGRRRLGQDPGPHPPHRLADRRAGRLAVRDPGHHLHQQGGRGDAPAGGRPGRPGGPAHVGVDLPRRLRAHPAPRRRPAGLQEHRSPSTTRPTRSASPAT